MVLVGRSRYGTRWIGRINERLSESARVAALTGEHFTPYQLILGTFTLMYAIRHLDDLLGVGGGSSAVHEVLTRSARTASSPLLALVLPRNIHQHRI